MLNFSLQKCGNGVCRAMMYIKSMIDFERANAGFFVKSSLILPYANPNCSTQNVCLEAAH